MYSYIKGIVSIIEVNYVVIENNGIGYLIYVPNPYSYKVGEETLIYLYQQIREEENTLYGFKDKEDKELFLKLIGVKGLGPKMALPMLGGDNKEDIYNAIETGNINYIKKFPKIWDKVQRQIVLNLNRKLVTKNEKNKIINNDELIDTLKSLGYRPNDIKRILPEIDDKKPLETQVKEALKLLLR